MTDAVVVGSGPNGLAAAITLAAHGVSVRVLEAHAEPGGGTRTAASTLPGFLHDVCSTCHPTGILSPFFRALPLGQAGLRWVAPRASVAHPLDDGEAALLLPGLDETARGLGADGAAYRALVEPLLGAPHVLLADLLAPLGIPRAPLTLARFGLSAIRSAAGLARARFRTEPARALFAGCAAHAIQPLERPLTAALGLVFALTAHVETWPFALGGSRAITHALVACLEALGGRVELGARVDALGALDGAALVLFDTSPREVLRIAGDALPGGYRARLGRYRYGPGVTKVDWALAAPIPWRDPRVGDAATIHLGGTLDELAAAERAMWRGEVPERPFVLACEPTRVDPSRAPAGRHVGYAYAHVPAGSDVDVSAAIEAQVERFAPGFRDLVLARHVTTARAFEAYNPAYVGGAITGGVADLTQLFTRPVARLDPYTTPNPRLYLCSAATPPGGGVHGMCGFFAARSALRRLGVRVSRDPAEALAPARARLDAALARR